MKILGIESSCDDTSVALVDCTNQGYIVLAEKTASQIYIHQKYGGVVPEIAGRAHAEKIVPLIETVLSEHGKPDAIAVTSGPGLITGLIVGVEAARTLGYAWDLPLVGVNHIAGHIHSVKLRNKKLEKKDPSAPKVVRDNSEIKFPALALIVSGGHTELILMRSHTDYKIMGKTKDDAAGECFDKVAKMLDLPYPGGPAISRLAKSGNPSAISFPRPMLKEDNLDFSFAGLKTAALYWLRDNKLKNINDFCASVEQAIVDVLVAKTIKAAKKMRPKTVILAGGVSANKKLRATLETEVKKQSPFPNYQLPAINYAMDNGAMIAVAGYYQAQIGNYTPWQKLEVNPNWKVDSN